MLHTAVQHIPVAVFQVLLQPRGQPSSHNGAHRVNDIVRRKVISFCQDGLSGRLFIVPAALSPFLIHVPAAGFPQLDSGRAVYRIVNAPVAGHKTAQHLGIGRIDNGSHLKPGNISLPEGYPVCQRTFASVLLLHGRNLLQRHNSFFPCLFLQEFILHPQDILIHGSRHPDVHERTQHHSLFLPVVSHFQIPVPSRIFLKFFQKIIQSFLLSAHKFLLWPPWGRVRTGLYPSPTTIQKQF